MSVNIKNEDVELLERIVNEVEVLSNYRLNISMQDIGALKQFHKDIEELRNTLNRIKDKQQVTNIKQSWYMANRRKTNPAYGRSKAEKEKLSKKE